MIHHLPGTKVMATCTTLGALVSSEGIERERMLARTIALHFANDKMVMLLL